MIIDKICVCCVLKTWKAFFLMSVFHVDEIKKGNEGSESGRSDDRRLSGRGGV